MFCNHCGAKNPKDVKFCSGCGEEILYPVDSPIGSQQEQTTTSTPTKYTDPTAQQPLLPKKQRKGKGCLIVIVIFVAFAIGFGIVGGQKNKNANPATSKVGTEESDIFSEIKTNVSDEQLVTIKGVLMDCGVTDIKSLKRDELIDGMFTYSEENGYGDEEGYRISTKDLNNINLYIKDGEVIGLSFASNSLYEESTVKGNLSDYYVSDSEWVSITSSASEFVKKTLKSPSTAKFPNRAFSPEAWSVYKKDGITYISSYVDAQNAFGAEVRSYFEIGTDGTNTVIYYVFDGEKLI